MSCIFPKKETINQYILSPLAAPAIPDVRIGSFLTWLTFECKVYRAYEKREHGLSVISWKLRIQQIRAQWIPSTTFLLFTHHPPPGEAQKRLWPPLRFGKCLGRPLERRCPTAWSDREGCKVKRPHRVNHFSTASSSSWEEKSF